MAIGLAAHQRVDQAGPVGLPGRLQFNRDVGTVEGNGGDAHATDQQTEEPQWSGQPYGSKGGLLGIAKYDMGETHAAGRKQRNARFAAQDRMKSGYRTYFADHLLADCIGGNEVAGG